jgi:hypothetical protein
LDIKYIQSDGHDFWSVECKEIFILEQAMKAQMGSRDIAVLFL